MARMIPSARDEGIAPGEIAVFDRLSTAPGTEDWVVFHSLGIARHVSQVEGEVDFVALVPGRGILIIEVKSHERVEADGDGWWKLGNGPRERKSPFDQAAGSMHSVMDYLASRGFEPIGYPIWNVVWFTSVPKERIPESIGWQQWMMLDRTDLLADDVAERIGRVLDRASAWLDQQNKGYRRVVGTPRPQDVERAVDLLEPRFVATLTAKDASRQRLAELQAFTEEQRTVLDMVGGNRRLLVEGPAGSGKTVLAVEAAVRAATAGQRVLFVVFNRLIESAIRDELRARGVEVEVRRIHALMNELAQVADPADAGSDWFDVELPILALEAALEGGPRFDALVLDEAQDLAREPFLDVLDCLLVGGLAAGDVLVTGDFENQYIFRDADQRPRERLTSRTPNLVPVRLSVNTRNTPELGVAFERLTGKSQLYSAFRRTDDEQVSVDELTYQTLDELDALLAAEVAKLLTEPFTVRDIVILAPVKDSAARRAADTGLRSRLGSGISDPKLIRWGTIHEFKGMEAPAVILTDLDPGNPYLQDLLYVGMTRATDRLVLLSRGVLAGQPVP